MPCYFIFQLLANGNIFVFLYFVTCRGFCLNLQMIYSTWKIPISLFIIIILGKVYFFIQKYIFSIGRYVGGEWCFPYDLLLLMMGTNFERFPMMFFLFLLIFVAPFLIRCIFLIIYYFIGFFSLIKFNCV